MSGTAGAEHRQERERNSGGAVGASWAVLLTMGGTSMTYNLWHATHGGHMNVWLALPEGVAPVLAAMLLSHIVGASGGARWMRAAAGLIMVGAMSLSMSATAAVVAPAAGTGWRWVFGAVIDAAALLAFQVILSDRHRRSAEMTAVQAAEERAGEAAADAARLRAEAAALRGESARAARESADAVALLESDLDRVRAELEAVRAAGPRPGADRSPDRSNSGSRDRSGTGAKTAARTGRRTAVPDDLDLEARALRLLAADLTMTGADLARELDISDSYGRKLRRRLAPSGVVGE